MVLARINRPARRAEKDGAICIADSAPKRDLSLDMGSAESFRINLRIWRERRGYSLRKLDELSGVTYSAISDIERGVTVPGLDMCDRLATALGVSVRTLLLPPPKRPVKKTKRG